MRPAIAWSEYEFGRAGGDDGELVAAEAGDQIVAAHDAAQALRDVENELVADMVAERVVDVLEMIEIDVEHRRGRTAAAHLADHGFEPLAEIDAVGQAADRVMQREVAEPRLTGGDRLRRSPRMAHDQAGEQRETGNRHRDEGQYAPGNLTARLAGFPGQAGDGVALRVGKDGQWLIAGVASIVDGAQAGQLQPIADLMQQIIVDIFDRDDDRRASVAGGDIRVGAHGHCGDDRRFVRDPLDQAGGTAGFARILCEHGKGMRRHGVEPSAQQIENGRQRRRQLDRSDVAGGPRARIFNMVGTIHHQDEVMVEEGLEPIAEPPVRPLRIVVLADRLRSPVGRGDAFDFAQHSGAAVLDRLLDELLVTFEPHFIRAPCGGEDRDDEANDRNGNDHADGNDQTQPRLVPPRPFAILSDVRLRRKVHAPTLWRCLIAPTIG